MRCTIAAIALACILSVSPGQWTAWVEKDGRNLVAVACDNRWAEADDVEAPACTLDIEVRLDCYATFFHGTPPERIGVKSRRTSLVVGPMEVKEERLVSWPWLVGGFEASIEGLYRQTLLRMHDEYETGQLQLGRPYYRLVVEAQVICRSDTTTNSTTSVDSFLARLPDHSLVH